MNRKIEICANSVDSCIVAEKGGAVRVELCSALQEGGVTPSSGMISNARKHLSIDINVLIRPRGGDFYYSASEVDTMLADILLIKSFGVQGFVFGCLNKYGEVDKPILQSLIDAARPLSVTFHRAFDMCSNPMQALEDIIELGCDRILTSGLMPNALQGITLIRELVEKAGDRIIIMPGCGINADNIVEIERFTNAKEFHASAQSVFDSNMIFRSTKVSMSSNAANSDFEIMQTDYRKVVALVNKTVI